MNFEDDGIMYTVRHVTDNFPHVVHIGDFVAMGDGSYPRMKRIAKADALAHKTWVRVMEDFWEQELGSFEFVSCAPNN